MKQLRTIVYTNDKYLWAMRPFAYLHNVYWSSFQPVVVGCFAPPKFPLPDNFIVHQIDNKNYPANKWSDGLIRLLNAIDDEVFILMLEDYWLDRTVDVNGVQAAYTYMLDRERVLRFDLTSDRQYAGGMFDVDKYGHYDIIETPPGTQYQFSTQAGIWRKSLLMDLLVPGKTAWETEIHTAPPGSMRVLGSRQNLVSYANVMKVGKLVPREVNSIVKEHREQVSRWIPKEVKENQ